MVKKKKVATAGFPPNAESPPSVVKEAEKMEAEKKEKWCMSVRIALFNQFLVELRSLDSVTHEQIEQLIAKYSL